MSTGDEVNENNNNNNNNVELSDCNCCEGIRKLTPAQIWNQPGLSSLKYRIGTHAMFKASMLASISEEAALKNLTTRESSDLTIAMLDAWSSVADVLTFYQERIVNEGFLRTATERRSILELARVIGYELRPGVAANTFLAFTIDDSGTSGSILETTIDAGTKVQSLPEAGQTPQVFETMEKITARPEWNELKPKTTKSQKLSDSLKSGRFIFKGLGKQLAVGDLLSIITKDKKEGDPEYRFRVITKVEENNILQQTQVDTHSVRPVKVKAAIGITEEEEGESSQVISTPVFIAPAGASAKELKELATLMGFSIDSYYANLRGAKKLQSDGSFGSNPEGEAEEDVKFAPGVYVFRAKTRAFGHNAPKYEAERNSTGRGWRISPIKDTAINKTSGEAEGNDNQVYLDNVYPNILKNSLVVIQNDTKDIAQIFQVSNIIERSIANFSLSARVTGLILKGATNNDLKDLSMRKTSIYAESELLELAEIPDDSPIAGDEIILSEKDIVPIEPGRLIAITGEPIEQAGEIQSEIAEIVDANSKWKGSSLTRILIQRAQSKSKVQYRRDTVTINANVAPATHGETTDEVLGSGDPSTRQQQQFMLKQKPLTYLISPNSPSGTESTLGVRVNGILWNEVSSLYGLKPEDRAYVVRRQDDGTTKIIFGDGMRGMRPLAGTGNITAEYRVGGGKTGLLQANQLSLLMSRPFAVRAVTNPIASDGADEPEKFEDARSNASLQVLTMDRIVSLEDFENFARAFPGIGKAQAVWVWNGEKKIVRLTIASTEGHEISDDSPIYEALRGAINKNKDPLIQMSIESFEKKLFRVKARIAVSSERRFEDVRVEVEKRLIQKFSFESRQFNQQVSKSEVIAIIQGVEGVVAVDIEHLYTVASKELINRTIKESLNDILPKYLEKGYVGGRFVTAPKSWVLYLLPDSIKIQEM